MEAFGVYQPRLGVAGGHFELLLKLLVKPAYGDLFLIGLSPFIYSNLKHTSESICPQVG